ncbi:MAG: hypothetical protein AB1564_04705 [Chloroflexota bacterium]
MNVKRIQGLEESLDPEARNKVVQLRSLLAELVITPPDKARQKLEATNDSRQAIWGDKVKRIPILNGSADDVYYALLECIVTDYAEQRVISVTVERVAAPATDEERERLKQAREQMWTDLNERAKDYYEKQLMKHMQKGKGRDNKTKDPGAVQEINLKIFFANQTFGPHRIIRVSQDGYYFLPCSNKNLGQ